MHYGSKIAQDLKTAQCNYHAEKDQTSSRGVEMIMHEDRLCPDRAGQL